MPHAGLLRPMRGSALLLLAILPMQMPAQAAPRAAVVAAPLPAGPGGWLKEFGTMWTFDAPPLDYWKARYGFEPSAAWLEHVRLSSVRIPGCSASFVSDRGLVMTNHHCARACISGASPRDTSYQVAGFVARTEQEERPCEGAYADQLLSTEDVTAKVRAAVTATATASQVEQRDRAIGELQSACQAAGGVVCQVVTFYQGGKYSLYRYRRYADVRLVMAPEEGISFFGGDPDNFTYPRYDLDLTLLRVYENGRPMVTPHYLRWNATGATEGDLTFVVGNPGSTGRLLTMAQLEYLRDVQYPASLKNFDAQIALYKQLSARDAASQRKYENTVFGLENSRKATLGYRAGLVDSAIMARKAAFERDFRARVMAQPALAAKYGGAWSRIAVAQRELGSFAVRQQFQGFGGGSTLLGLAATIVRLPEQAQLPQSLRLNAFREAGLARMEAQVRQAVPIDVELETRLLAMQFTLAQRALPPGDPFLAAALRGRTPEAAAAALVGGTTLGSVEARVALLTGGAAAVRASTDPLVVLARAVNPMATRHAMRAQRLATTISANTEVVGQAMYAAYGERLPPDATFTLRISDGVVQGFPYNGTVAPYKTSLYGLFGRSAEFDNQPPFRLPPRWEAARDRLDLTTPINFVLTADIIGGNSGSPVINRAGEVVGLIFDGNIESLPNRFIYTDDVARSVAVHTRGISEALRKVYGAARLADEVESAGARP
ncbi:MAG: S46 family peptidase [Gemmatimonadales bacterium]|nr:S46 family peptidase [Gemmatimonadales bacterium]